MMAVTPCWLQSSYILNVFFCSSPVRGHWHRDLGGGEPQAGRDRAEGHGGMREDRPHPRGGAQDVRQALRRN